MRINYYNLGKDGSNRKISPFKKYKMLTIWFRHVLEKIQFENSDRGYLLWICTSKTIRVFGFWKQGENRKLYQHWRNDHCCCGF